MTQESFIPHNALPVKVLAAVASTMLLLLLYSIYNHDFYVDEAFIGEYAYFLARDGYVHSGFWSGYLRQDEYVVLYHHLSVWAGALMLKMTLKIGGLHLLSVRFVSILSGSIVLVMLARYLRHNYIGKWSSVWLGVILLLLMPTFFYSFKCYRPEMQTAMLGFASYYALYKYIREFRWQFAVVAGACAGAAMLSHLAGAMYVGAGVGMLLVHKRYAHAVVFAGIAGLVFAPYPIDVLTHWDYFTAQTSNPQAQAKLVFTFWTPLLHLFHEQQRFFWKPQFILMSVAWLVALAISWRHGSHEQHFLRLYSLFLVLVLGAALEDKRDYMVLYAPFMALVIVFAIESVLRSSAQRMPKIALAVAITAFAGYGLYFQVRDTFLTKEPIGELNHEIGAYLPDGARCVAPMNMMYNELPRLTMFAFSNAADRVDGDVATTTVQGITRFCDSHAVEYVITNRYGEPRECVFDAAERASELASAFETIAYTSEYSILKRRAPNTND